MITGVVLARNEEANIVGCLEALQHHVEELILIDMESTDQTVAHAEPLVHKVLHHPLVPDFDAARNLAIAEGKFDWFWFVDADERISPQTGQVVRQLVHDRGHEFEALVIPFKSYFCGQWMRHCGWWPGYTMPRVLKRGSFRFVERVHGGVEVNGRQIRLPPDPELGIDHFSYRSVEHYLEKLNRYTSTEAVHLERSGAQWDWRDALRDMIRDLWMYYEYNPGHLDGARGWVLAWLSGQYRWLSRAKLVDQPPSDPDSPPPNGGMAPSSLDQVLDLWQRELSALRSRHPRLPLGIVWRSPLFDPSGYADESRAFVKGLAAGNRELRVEEIRWSDTPCDLEAVDAVLIKALTHATRPNHVATITDCIPTLVEPDPHSALNILRTTFETDRLPVAWLPQLAKFDEVWVPSQQNFGAFRRSGFPPEKLRVVSSCYNNDLYQISGPRLVFPNVLDGRFVFLSVFDWQLRKGWDVLLRAYCQEFSASEPVGLLLKITRAHGHTLPLVRAQADEVLSDLGQSLVCRPDIVLWDGSLTAGEMAAMYRSASAFVLPSRGEGWGRPYMEAMACGLPTIGTRHLGSADFLSDENSYLVDASLVPIPEAAAAEIPPYRGHWWYEPDLIELRRAMRRVSGDTKGRESIAARAAAEMPERFGLIAGNKEIQTALADAERRFQTPTLPPATADQIRVALEGEFFALHSFANVNEQLALHLSVDSRLALKLERIRQQPAYDDEVPHAWRLRPYFDRALGDGPEITIRHAFPPNWQPVQCGSAWVHIQPWEFGHLPVDWIEPLQKQVDEIWVPTRYVKRVFERSGIPGEKIQVISWGVDPVVFSPGAEPLLLPTEKTFRILYVGGLIGRKGFDTLLEAYLAEFGPDDDVCLVVKDIGSHSFYRHGNFREQLLAARDATSSPEIVYLEQPLTTGQLASLYTSCHCFAAPYRAEGFGLPILEAMASGLAPIIPHGGAADDFTTSETALLMPSQEIQTTHNWPLVGPALQLSISVNDVRRALRLAFQDRERTRRIGQTASRTVLQRYTWEQTATAIADRLVELRIQRSHSKAATMSADAVKNRNGQPLVAACIVARGAERQLADALAQVVPFVDETVVVIVGCPDRSELIAKEYGAKVVIAPEVPEICEREVANSTIKAEWVFWLHPSDRLVDFDGELIREMVINQPPQIAEVLIDLPGSRFVANAGQIDGKLHIYRRAGNGVIRAPIEAVSEC